MEEINKTMQGKICLVTGATSGIGAVSALALAAKGATVIVGARNQEKAESTVRKIQEQTGNLSVEYMLTDLSSLAQVRQLAQEVQARYLHLDVLLNNAGVILIRRQTSVDGYEKTWATNHLNYFLLTDLLLPMLQKSLAGRVVNVASSAHWRGRIRFDDLQFTRGYRFMKAYAQSKLANMLFTRELAQRLKGSSVTANAVHPGLVRTGLGPSTKLTRRLLNVSVLRKANSPDEGAATLIYLASSPEVAGISGKYFVDMQPASSSERSQDMDTAKRLWQVSEKMVAIG